MPDVDDFIEMTILEIMRKAAKFSVTRTGEDWTLVAKWKDGQFDATVIDNTLLVAQNKRAQR